MRLARRSGVDVLAVTDHDTTEALDECLDEAARVGVRVIPGIELSSRFGELDVHILGLGIDPRSAGLEVKLASLHDQRRARVGKICEKLNALGLGLDPQEVLREAGGKSIGRKHIARAMLKKGLVASLDEAFQKYLGTRSPANVPANELSPAQAASLVLECGGVPVLAHPGFLDDAALVEQVLDAAPIRAIEVYHRYESKTLHLTYLDMARRRNLLVTGGSDFHGDDNAKNAGLGSFTCPPDDWKAFERRLRPL